MAEEIHVQRTLGAGVYTESLIPLLYQRLVLGFNFPYAWKCPIDTLKPFFLANFSKRHLDCGVANGYFCEEALSQSSGPTSEQHITLLDLNPASLEHAKRVLLSKAPETDIQCVEADIRGPVPDELQGVQFDSISMYNLFHCVPGGSSKFHQALKLYGELLTPGGVLYGCTILGKGYIQNLLARLTMVAYNWLGIFSNWDDTEDDVLKALHSEFDEVETQLVGMVLFFKARSKK